MCLDIIFEQKVQSAHHIDMMRKLNFIYLHEMLKQVRERAPGVAEMGRLIDRDIRLVIMSVLRDRDCRLERLWVTNTARREGVNCHFAQRVMTNDHAHFGNITPSEVHGSLQTGSAPQVRT